MVWTDPGSLSAASVARTHGRGNTPDRSRDWWAGLGRRLAARFYLRRRCICVRSSYFCMGSGGSAAGLAPRSAEGEVIGLDSR